MSMLISTMSKLHVFLRFFQNYNTKYQAKKHMETVALEIIIILKWIHLSVRVDVKKWIMVACLACKKQMYKKWVHCSADEEHTRHPHVDNLIYAPIIGRFNY